MIKGKEYPATHSMSTSWFGVDRDGKIAIIDFNENGPVPPNLGEYCGVDIVEYEFPNQLGNGMYEIPLTDYQAEAVIQYLDFSTTDADIDFDHIVKINPDYTSEFISTIGRYPSYDGIERKIIRLSERLGLYLCDFYEISKKTIKSLISKGIIQRNRYFSWDYGENFNTEKDRWDINTEQGSCLLPIYYYVQPYSTGQLIERVNEPDNPLSETQIAPAVRSRGLRFPFSFKDQKSFQILEYYHAISNCGEISTDNCEHIRVPLTDGTEGIIQTSFLPAISCKDCNICRFPQKEFNPWYFPTDRPTGLIISGMMRPYDWQEVMDDSYNRCVDSSICYKIPGHKILPFFDKDEQVAIIEGEKGKEWFSCIANIIIDASETMKPYCLLVESRLMPIIRDLFPVAGEWITLGTQKIRIFESDNLAENKCEIRELLSKPYRGRSFNRIQRLADK